MKTRKAPCVLMGTPNPTGSGDLRAVTITRLAVYEGCTRTVHWSGRIIAENKFWVVDYTASEPGWIDRDYRPTFTTQDAAWRHVEKLGRRCHIPAAVLASAGSES